MTPTDPPTAVPITAAELDTICEALRYTASDMLSVGTVYRRNDVSELRGLAYALEARHAAALAEAGRVDAGEGKDE